MKVAAGKPTVIEIPIEGAVRVVLGEFKIVLKTNGRPTTQTGVGAA